MRVIAIIFCLFCITRISAEEPGIPGKKERKEISRIFGSETAYRKAEISVDNSILQPYLKQGDAVFELIRNELVLGYLLSTQAKGRFDLFDYSVIFSEELTVLNIMVLVYRSTHGAGICSKSWLKQFKGYSGEELELGKDIDTISGATFSASSMVKDIERCYQLMLMLRDAEVIH
ncbi:MAG: FMN-binding protein [Bacteroidota bacterium]